MSIRRIGVLLAKEIFQGPKNYLFIFAIATPFLISIMFSLIFGTLFSEKPRLGIVDEDSSQLVTLSLANEALVTKEYDSFPEMKEAVEIGSVDLGIVLPQSFDSAVVEGRGST